MAHKTCYIFNYEVTIVRHNFLSGVISEHPLSDIKGLRLRTSDPLACHWRELLWQRDNFVKFYNIGKIQTVKSWVFM